MESIDLLVLRTAADWSTQGHRVMLATVVRTWGSSPRPVGSMMALREDGRVVGSVSGGCIEDDLIYTRTAAFAEGKLSSSRTELVRYGVSADEAHRFGLPCGGTLELLLEYQPSHLSFVRLLDELRRGRLVRRTVDISSGEVTLSNTSVPETLMFDGRQMINTLGPGYRMLLIGGGALAEYVATMALFNGFEVTVCDPRREHIDTWSVPGADIVRGMPDDEVIAFKPDVRSAVIALSHDPKLDDLALLMALKSTAFYVGAIGSRRNNQARRERLIEHFGESEQSLRRLRGPIGLFIGSKTPSEIAVSIMAEVLALKNGVALDRHQQVGDAKNHLERTRDLEDRLIR